MRSQLGRLPVGFKAAARCAPASFTAGARTTRGLKVAAGQFKALPDPQANLAKMLQLIEDAGQDQVDLIAFAETAITGYFPEVIAAMPQQELEAMEVELRAACAQHHVAAVFGAPHHGMKAGNPVVFNSATVVDKSGDVVGRQHKLQLVPTDHWATAGESLQVMWLCDQQVPISVIVCHDKRYPELVRLPVLAGMCPKAPSLFSAPLSSPSCSSCCHSCCSSCCHSCSSAAAAAAISLLSLSSLVFRCLPFSVHPPMSGG